jgi:signal transduction histidine kinase
MRAPETVVAGAFGAEPVAQEGDKIALASDARAGPTGGPAGGRAGARARLVPVWATSHDIRSWLFPLAVITMTGVGAGVLAAGLPEGAAGASTVSLLAVAVTLSVVALSDRIRDLRLVVPALVGLGLCGAGLDWQADGPGLVAGYVALIGLALRTPRRIALIAGTPVVAAVAAEETYESANPAATSLAVVFAFGFLFITSAFAAISLDARHQAEALLAQEAATGEARARAAALAERSRLARDLHDVLAHSLSALAVQLEATRLMAITTGAGSRLVHQVTSAHKLTRIGMLNAHRALEMLRGEQTPGPAGLPDLVSETAAALGIPIIFEVDGVPRPLGPEAGLTLYRVVQEALTNVAKHAGRGARAAVRLVWEPGGVEVSIVDTGGDGVDAGLPSSGFGLTSMAERAALNGGWLHASRSDGGFAVRVRLPLEHPPTLPPPQGGRPDAGHP